MSKELAKHQAYHILSMFCLAWWGSRTVQTITTSWCLQKL